MDSIWKNFTITINEIRRNASSIFSRKEEEEEEITKAMMIGR